MAVETNGLPGALAQAIKDASGAAEPEAEQLSLLAQEPILGEIKREGAVLNRGRPPGARNRRTEDLAAYILSRHRNPIEAAAEIVDTPIPVLAKALGCDKLDAAQYQRQCMELVARYTLQAMPQALKIDTATAGTLMVINMNAPRPGDNAVPLSPHGLDAQVVKNQGVSEAEDLTSHGSPSHGEAK
jgi:hypothetical protein